MAMLRGVVCGKRWAGNARVREVASLGWAFGDGVSCGLATAAPLPYLPSLTCFVKPRRIITCAASVTQVLGRPKLPSSLPRSQRPEPSGVAPLSQLKPTMEEAGRCSTSCASLGCGDGPTAGSSGSAPLSSWLRLHLQLKMQHCINARLLQPMTSTTKRGDNGAGLFTSTAVPPAVRRAQQRLASSWPCCIDCSVASKRSWTADGTVHVTSASCWRRGRWPAKPGGRVPTLSTRRFIACRCKTPDNTTECAYLID